MGLAAAQMIGAGLACIALVGAGIGIGNVFGSYLEGALRNPGAPPARPPTCSSASRCARRRVLFGLVIALIILYAK